MYKYLDIICIQKLIKFNKYINTLMYANLFLFYLDIITNLRKYNSFYKT